MPTSIEIISFILIIKDPFSLSILVTTVRVKDGKTMSFNINQEPSTIKRGADRSGKKRASFQS